MTDCIFCKIIKGEIPSAKVFENEHCYAFLDLFPQQKGHVLVIPKVHNDHILDLEEPHHLKLFATGQFIGKALHKAFNTNRVAYLVEGFGVAHTHLHLIPINKSADLLKKEGEPQKASVEELTEVQKLIIEELEKLK